MPLQVVKTGGHEKKTVLVNLTFSIFCGKPNLFLRNQHRLCIAPFIRKPWVRNSDPCFSLSWNCEKLYYLCSESRGPNFGSLLSLRWNSENIHYLCSEKQGSEFRTLAFRSAEIVKKYIISVQKAGVRISDPCFSLRWNSGKNYFIYFQKAGVRISDPCFSLRWNSEKIHYLCSESRGPNFGSLLFAPLK